MFLVQQLLLEICNIPDSCIGYNKTIFHRHNCIFFFIFFGQGAPPVGGITYSHRIELSAALSAHSCGLLSLPSLAG